MVEREYFAFLSLCFNSAILSLMKASILACFADESEVCHCSILIVSKPLGNILSNLLILYDKEDGKSLEWDWEGSSQAQNNSVLTRESSKRRESVKLQRKITRKVYVSHN